MPTNRQLPSWVRAAEPERYLLPAVQAGASIAEANARMAQQAQDASARQGLAQQEMALRQQQSQDAQMEQQQRMAIAQEYHKQQQAIQQQKIEEAKRINDMKVQQAARQYQARQQYSDLVSKGVDPIKAAFMVPGLNIPGGGMASMANQQSRAGMANQPVVPPTHQGGWTFNGKQWVQDKPAGVPADVLAKKKEESAQKQADINAEHRIQEGFYKDLGLASRQSVKDALQKQIDDSQKRIAEIRGGTVTAPKSPPGSYRYDAQGSLYKGDDVIYQPPGAAPKGLSIGGAAIGGQPSAPATAPRASLPAIMSAPTGVSIGGTPLPTQPQPATPAASPQDQRGLQPQDLHMKPQIDYAAVQAAQEKGDKDLVNKLLSGIGSVASTIFDTGSDIYNKPAEYPAE